MDLQVWKGRLVLSTVIAISVALDLGGLEGLERLEMHGFSSLEGVSGVNQRNAHFGSPIEKKVSDLGGLEGLDSLEMHGFPGLEGCRVLISVMPISVAL